MSNENINNDFYYDIGSILPTNDLLFKKIFWNKEYPNILISFINAVLKRKDPIVSVDLISTELDSHFLVDHGIRLDLMAKTSSGELLNIEMQNKNDDDMYKRTLYYWARLYSSQLAKGKEYATLKPVITINILDFILFKDNRCHRNFILKDEETNEARDRMLDIHFIELKKRQYMNQNDELWAWAEFLKSPKSEYLSRDNEYGEAENVNMKSIKDAQAVYEEAIADPTEQEKIRLLDKTQRDNLSSIAVAKSEGELNAKIETAKNMLENGLSIEMTAKCTGLSVEEIKKL